jgi:hypothetical protein
LKGRQFAAEYTEFYRRYLDGCQNIKLLATAPLMGVRESRRVVGDYELGYADFQARAKFPDQIGVYNKAVDIHPYDLSEQEYKRY